MTRSQKREGANEPISISHGMAVAFHFIKAKALLKAENILPTLCARKRLMSKFKLLLIPFAGD